MYVTRNENVILTFLSNDYADFVDNVSFEVYMLCHALQF